MDGATAIVRGAIDSGCTFFAGYPITPATPIFVGMVQELGARGGIAIEGEDEIASIGFCIGAAMAGRKAMTATSGPGISLMSEQIGFAIMAEVPLVIVDCQRLGPATGGATSPAQGDVQFLRWGTSGGVPVTVYAPATIPDCYELTQQAFRVAEELRMPVFLLVDKDVVLGRETVETAGYVTLLPSSRPTAPAGDPSFLTYRFDRAEEVPPFAPVGGPLQVRVNTSTHDQAGILTKLPAAVEALNRHLHAKVSSREAELARLRLELPDSAETLLVGYGSTGRAVEEAARSAARAGVPLGHATLLSLWPLASDALARAMARVRRVVVVELNLGLMKREIERVAPPGVRVEGVHRVDGRPIHAGQILEAVGVGL